MMKPERLSRTVVYRSPWVNLYLDRVRFPGGRVIERHHLLDFESPSVVAYVADGEGRVLLVSVCRYTTAATGWELPAGSMQCDEEIFSAVAREVLEETGYNTLGHELVYSYYPMNGIANKLVHVVRCQARERACDFDQDEVDEVGWFSPAEVWRMVHDREMTDGLSLVAFLLCQCAQKRSER